MMAERGGRGRLILRELGKSYDGVPAVDGVSLVVAPGEFVSLLGPSGCGKTTILRCVSGLVDVSAGEILVDGRSLDRVPAWRRDLGMVFQHYALFPHMSVRGNVAFGLRMRRTPAPATERRVDEALALVEMTGLADRFPAQLSGGQQQRVALARALVTEPTVLLLDEPFGALDAKLRAAMQLELRQLQRRLGITTLFVTHDQDEAMTLSDRIAVMRRGQIEQIGTPQDIYRTPRTAFVAEFIGQMNRLTGTVAARDTAVDRVALRWPGGPERLIAAAAGAPVSPGGNCLVMMRPERVDIVPVETPGGAEMNRLDGRIDELIFTGDRVSIFVACGGQRVLSVLPDRGQEGPGLLSVGKVVGVTWRVSDTHLFPAESTR